MYELVHKQQFQANVGIYHGPTDPTGRWLGIRESNAITPVDMLEGKASSVIWVEDVAEKRCAIASDGKRIATLHNGHLSIVSKAGIESSVQLVPPGDEGREIWDLNSCVWCENVSFMPCGRQLVATVKIENAGLLLLIDAATLEILDTARRKRWASTSLFVSHNGIVGINQVAGDSTLGSHFYRCDNGKIQHPPKFLDPLDDDMPELYHYELLGFSSDGQRFIGMNSYSQLWEIDWQTWKPLADQNIFSDDEIEDDDTSRFHSDQACYLGSDIAAIVSDEEDYNLHFKIRFYSVRSLKYIYEIDLPVEVMLSSLTLHPGGYITAARDTTLDLWQIVPSAISKA